MEYKALKLQIKEFDEAGTFEGYASVFGNADSYGDVVEPGAFSKTISENQGKFPLLFFHDPRQPIGMTSVKEDDHGLFVRGEIDLETEAGRSVYSGLKKGYIDRMSIGYRTIKDAIEGRLRKLKEIKLLENSLVTRNFAANELALVTGVKSLEPWLKRATELPGLLKAGDLTDEHRLLIQEAVRSLRALLEATEPGHSTPGHKEPPKDTGEPDEATLRAIIEDIKATVRSVK